MALWLTGTDDIDPGRIGLALLAFTFIFIAYVLGTVLSPDLSLLYPIPDPPKGPEPRAVTISKTEVRDLFVWWTFAYAAILLSIVATTWCARLLVRHCPKAIFQRALLLFGLVALVAAAMAHSRGNAMVEISQRHSCSEPNSQLYCSAPSTSALTDYLALFEKGGGTSLDAAAFGDEFNALKTLLNIFLQAAAIFVIGSMLTVTGISFTDPAASAEHFAKLANENVLRRLLLAGGAVLSTITLTDILFTNWPINSFGSSGASELTALLGALTFYYAMLGSMVLLLGLVLARALASTPLPLLAPPAATSLNGIVGKILAFFSRKSTINAIVALSPVLTYAVGNPLLKEAVDALTTG